MRFIFLSKCIPLSILLLATFLAGGCGEAVKPPTPISLEQIPAELKKAFASAAAETKDLSDLAATVVQSKDFPKASMTLTALAQRPDLTKIQSRIVAGATMTVNAALLEAESKGDPQAVETLNLRRMTK
jgi:hypothetical protein